MLGNLFESLGETFGAVLFLARLGDRGNFGGLGDFGCDLVAVAKSMYKGDLELEECGEMKSLYNGDLEECVERGVRGDDDGDGDGE